MRSEVQSPLRTDTVTDIANEHWVPLSVQFPEAFRTTTLEPTMTGILTMAMVVADHGCQMQHSPAGSSPQRLHELQLMDLTPPHRLYTVILHTSSCVPCRRRTLGLVVSEVQARAHSSSGIPETHSAWHMGGPPYDHNLTDVKSLSRLSLTCDYGGTILHQGDLAGTDEDPTSDIY